MNNNSDNLNNLNQYTLDFNNQEISREELIKTFEILYKKGLINNSELQRAISISNSKYKSIRQIIRNSVSKSDNK